MQEKFSEGHTDDSFARRSIDDKGPIFGVASPDSQMENVARRPNTASMEKSQPTFEDEIEVPESQRRLAGFQS